MIAAFLAVAAAATLAQQPQPVELLEAAADLLNTGNVPDALKTAHLALGSVAAGNVEEEHEAHMHVGNMYMHVGLNAAANVFYEHAKALDPAADEEDRQSSFDDPLVVGGLGEEDLANLHRLALQLFASGQLDVGLRADAERIAQEYRREEGGADLNTLRDAVGRSSALLLASGFSAHTIAMARNLLSHAANPTTAGTRGYHPLSCSGCKAPNLQMFGATDKPLGVQASDVHRFIGCCLSRRHVLQRLLQAHNVSLDQQNVYGYTPLHLAAAADQPELVSALLSLGANASAQTFTSQATPLHIAATRNATAAIKVLVNDPAGRLSLPITDSGVGLRSAPRTAADVACHLGFKHAASLIDPGRECGVESIPINSADMHMMCGIDVRLQHEVSAQQLLRDYVFIGKPVMIKGNRSGETPAQLGSWFDAGRWRRDRLRDTFGHLQVQVGDIPYAASFGLPSKPMSLDEYYAAVLDKTTGKADRSIVAQPSHVYDPRQFARGFLIDPGTILDPEITALHPSKVHFTLGPRGSGSPMRLAKASVDVLIRGTRTWLLQAPSEAMYSTLHPADATKAEPWPWPKRSLYSCDQEAGDILFVPDMWGSSMLNNEESLGVSLEVETGLHEFSIHLEEE